MFYFFFAHSSSLEEKIDLYLTEKKFQGVALVALEQKIILKKAYGLANEEKSIPNSLSTLFRVGSITKEFTAAAILLLQERGLLHVSDTIDTYIPNYPNGEQITIHHLLTHTSGIMTLSALPHFESLKNMPTSSIHSLSYFKDEPLKFSPGSDIEYSDSGYILLGAIIENITKQSYSDFLERNLFQLLGMHSTYVESNTVSSPKQAKGYRSLKIPAHTIDMSFPHAAGAIVSSAEDLYKWNQSLIQGELLSPESLKSLLSVQAFSYEHQIAYGYGFRIGPCNKDFSGCEPTIIGHLGSIDGFKAASVHYREQNLTIILLSNQEQTDIRNLHKQIAQIVFSRWRVSAI